ALGPWGLAAAIGLKLISDGLSLIKEEALALGDKAIAVRRFSEATGLAAGQIGALKKAGAEFGIGGDEIAGGFSRLAFQLNEVHRAGGPLFEQVRQVSAGLADQLVKTEDEAEAIQILSRAYRDATS